MPLHCACSCLRLQTPFPSSSRAVRAVPPVTGSSQARSTAGRRQKGSKTVRGHDNTPNCSMPVTIWSFLLWPHAPLPGLSVSASNKKNLTPKPRASPTKDGEIPVPLFLCQGVSGCGILSTGFCLSPHLARAISNLRAPSAPVEHGIKGRQWQAGDWLHAAADAGEAALSLQNRLRHFQKFTSDIHSL